MEKQVSTQASIHSLPLELRQCILLLLPNLRSLACAALSCRSLYLALVEDKEQAVRQVLVNRVGSDVLPEAVIVWQCSPPVLSALEKPQLSQDQTEDLYHFALDFLDTLERPTLSSIPWDWKSAFSIEGFQFFVEEFTERFIKFCVETPHVELGKSFDSRPLSSTERARIARTLYRFEMYRKLLGCQRNDYAMDSAYSFFSKFAPLENAQLACVHDFLAQLVVPVFDEVAKHDIVWGEHQVPFDNDLTSPHIQYLLSLGLKELHRIATSNSWADKVQALCVQELPPGLNYCFLHDSLDSLKGDVDSILSDGMLKDDELLDMIQQGPFYDDGDAGPKEIWTLSQGQSALAIYENDERAHRQWGYVMWDKARLQTTGILELPWKSLEAIKSDPVSLSVPDIQRSWDARTAISERGGRGWWDENDETQLVWPKRNKDPEPARPVQIPLSLEEAKILWKSYQGS